MITVFEVSRMDKFRENRKIGVESGWRVTENTSMGTGTSGNVELTLVHGKIL